MILCRSHPRAGEEKIEANVCGEEACWEQYRWEKEKDKQRGKGTGKRQENRRYNIPLQYPLSTPSRRNAAQIHLCSALDEAFPSRTPKSGFSPSPPSLPSFLPRPRYRSVTLPICIYLRLFIFSLLFSLSLSLSLTSPLSLSHLSSLTRRSSLGLIARRFPPLPPNQTPTAA
jgi:hypothetical protein